MSVYYMNTPFALAEQGMGSSVWMAQLAMAQATPEAPLGLQGRAETVKQNKQAWHWTCLSSTYRQTPSYKGSGLLLGRDQIPNGQGYLGFYRHEIDYHL